MTFSPVRVARNTKQLGKSKLHWTEKLEYKVLFAYEGRDENVKKDVLRYVEEKMIKYEEMTVAIRSRFFETTPARNDDCVASLSGNLKCSDFNGSGCISCDFDRAMWDWERTMSDLKKGNDTKEKHLESIENAEMFFDDAGEMIVDREYLVSHTLRL